MRAGMGDRTESPQGGIVSGGWPGWLASVAFAVLPLALFLAGIEVFTAGGVSTAGLVLKDGSEDAPILSPLATGYGDISYFKYSVYVFVHILICLVVGLHFLSRLSVSKRRGPALVIGLVFAAIVIAAAFVATGTETAFRGFMVAPFSDMLIKAGARLPAFAMGGEIHDFLTLALVTPTSVGILVVVLATCSFHAAIFFGRSRPAESRQDALNGLATLLRRDMVALSIVLVSSVLTARAYFAIPAAIFSSDDGDASKFYLELARTLSTGSGLLFSATLFAAFAPGFFALAAMSAKDSEPGKGPSAIWPGLALELGSATQRFKSSWQPLMAFVAPAVSAPLFDLLSGFIG